MTALAGQVEAIQASAASGPRSPEAATESRSGALAFCGVDPSGVRICLRDRPSRSGVPTCTARVDVFTGQFLKGDREWRIVTRPIRTDGLSQSV